MKIDDIIDQKTANLVDPDTYVNWHREDEPGQNPRWESKCGVIVQISSGPKIEYWGFPWKDDNRVVNYTSMGIYYSTFARAKRQIELKYFEQHPEENAPPY